MSSDEPSDDPTDELAGDGDADRERTSSGVEDDPTASGGGREPVPTAGATTGRKHCISCGEDISADAAVCPECGVNQSRVPGSAGPGRTADEKYCTNCGAVINREAEMCPECGTTQTVGISGEKDKLAAALIAIFLGGLGIHKFYLGDNRMGVIYLCFFWTGIPALLGLIEGIIYLTKTDEEFQWRYVTD
ncbi:TM2 domain-containing protein [Halorarum halophilum]|uniref:TM2 domain-containing protein n=1 Tax=Halorarum halophilum TaxID=2743090 RepID=A0A7D5KTZ9_9EURY|nr:TM2 domain-containing protein [Halobaculum halophilum]QLG26740.1 TM2 domain-containing protein [Halobaculum halophilum]